MLKIGLTYDLQTDAGDERQAEFDPPRTIECVSASLESLGHQVYRIGNAQDLLASIERWRALDLVFNIAEGSGGRCREAWVPALLELLHIPYVGSAPGALAIGLDKVASKRLALGCGVRTPAWMMFTDVEKWDGRVSIRLPAIVKPRYEGSGIGIDEGAVVSDPPALRQRVQWLSERVQQPILVEEFVPSGELTVCVIGNAPPAAYPAIQRPLDPRTRLASHVVPRAQGWEAPIELTPALDAEARGIALKIFTAMGCRDMARIDLRVDADGRCWFLEINPLPSVDPDGSFGLLAEYLGTNYTQIIGRILDAARMRLSIQDPA